MRVMCVGKSTSNLPLLVISGVYFGSSLVVAGAGSAGLGVCTAIKDGMLEAGLTEAEAMKNFVVCVRPTIDL